MSKAKKKSQAKGKPVDNGYPFDTGDWAKWSNRKRLDWMVNFRDKLRDKFKEKYSISDQQIAQMSADVETLRELVSVEESNPTTKPDFQSKPPGEKVELTREWLDDISANNNRKARLVGFTDADMERMWAEHDKYAKEVKDWQRRQLIPMMPVTAIDQIDPSPLADALERGDIETAKREIVGFKRQFEDLAERDPAFGAWYTKFTAEQAIENAWDDTIGDEE